MIPCIAEAQILPEPNSPAELNFARLDMFFTAVFTVGLVLNMAATLISEFFASGWNWCAAYVKELRCILAIENTRDAMQGY